jgi:hypothetical protein
MSDGFLGQRINIKFRMKLGKNASDICAFLSEAYRGETMNTSSVSECRKLFKEGRKCMEGDERSGHSRSQRSNENDEKVRNLVHWDGRLSIRAISVQLNLDRQWKGPEIWHSDWILHRDNAPAHRPLSVKRFRAQKSKPEVKQKHCSPDSTPNDFWLFSK